MSQSMKEWIRFFITIIILGLIVLGLRKFVFTPVEVKGTSMDPTLQDGEHVIALLNQKVDRYDIVTFPAPDEEGKNYIKRVIGMPGDTVAYKDDELYINDEKVEETYLQEYKDLLTDGKPLTPDFTLESLQTSLTQNYGVAFPLTEDGKIPEGKLFVLGDNRRVSKDSRIIGYINTSDIIGDVKFCIWPLSRFGTVK